MASKPSSAAFKKVAKLADDVNENRIELAFPPQRAGHGRTGSSGGYATSGM